MFNIKYASDLMVNKYGVSQNLAGLIPSLLPLGTLFLTPLFGSIYDKKGKGATMMIIGASLIIFVHSMFSLPGLNHWFIAVALVIILDNVGDFTSNMTLSEKRAKSVVNELVTKYSVKADQLKAYGVASLSPITSNLKDEGKAKNRRVEIVKQ